ncbi:MAG: phosphate acetyltransferase [Chlorobiaceae bacterium]|nr:phosphate acetyltransferase [Chlorobiaceae bacterium]
MNPDLHAFASDEPPEIQVRSHDRYHKVMQACASLPPLLTAVAHPVHESDILAIKEAVDEQLITPVLVGPEARILLAASKTGIDVSSWKVVDAGHSHESAEKAARLARDGMVQAIMKGSIHTDELLAPIVAHGSGLRSERRLSHAYVMDTAGYHKWLIVTDAVVNIAPDLGIKADICRNAIDAWQTLTRESRPPRIAVLAAVEVVNPAMQATIDAASLCKMAQRGQITGCVIDGPLAFDNAISMEAARKKGITSEVAGDADILLAPDIEAANILAKQLTFISHADAAGIVMGARIPIILTSRADNLRARLLSCALAVLVVEARREGLIK